MLISTMPQAVRGFRPAPAGAQYPFVADPLPPYPFDPSVPVGVAPKRYGAAYGAACRSCREVRDVRDKARRGYAMSARERAVYAGMYGAVSPNATAYNARGVGGWDVRPGGVFSGRDDPELADIVDTYQQERGLTADGALGPQTLREIINDVRAYVAQGRPAISNWGSFWDANLIVPENVEPEPGPTPGPTPEPGPTPVPIPPEPGPVPTPGFWSKYKWWIVGGVVGAGGLYFALKG